MQTAPTEEEKDNIELLNTDEGEPGVVVEKEDETVVAAYVYANKDFARAAFLKGIHA